MPVAALAGPIIGGVGSIVGGIMGGSAAKKAADAQAKAAQAAADISKQNANQAIDYNKSIYAGQQQTAAPWINNGQSAIGRVSQLMGIGPPPGGGAPGTAVNPNMNTDTAVRSAGQLNNTTQNAYGLSDLSLGNGNSTSVNSPTVIHPELLKPGMPGYAEYGSKPGMWRGGKVHGPGTPTSDSVPIKASEGEFIVRADVARQPGVMAMLEHLNRGGKIGGDHFATGGVVDATAGNQMAQVPPGTILPNGQGATNAMMPPASAGDLTAAPGPSADGVMTAGGGAGVPATVAAPPQGSTNAPGADGSFGSLTQGYGAFQAPDGLTEQNEPGFQARLAAGQQALERSAAARGSVLNGGTLKALDQYSQDQASNEYNNTYSRALSTYGTNFNTYNTNQNNLYARLMGISGSGQNSAGQLGAEGTAAANNNSNVLMTSAGQQGQDLTNAGTARASGYVGAANAYGSILPNIGNSITMYDLMKQRGAA